MGIIQMLLLGVGMAMDASAVSMTNGLVEPKMKVKKALLIAFFFGFFQFAMPLIGFLAGSVFTEFLKPFTAWLALILLSIIGGKMLIEGIKAHNDEAEEVETVLTLKGLFLQAIATSIDALTLGLIFIGMEFNQVFLACGIIGIVTFILSFVCVYIGKAFGNKLQDKAQIIGGIILIVMGLKIFIEYLIEVL